MKKQNLSLEEQILSCREGRYILKIGIWIMIMMTIFILSIVFSQGVIPFIPLFHSTDCLYIASEKA
jgi:hypothetical protein